MVEISVLGISLRDEDKTPLLLLHPHGSQGILTLDIGSVEAFAVSLALHGMPHTHTPRERENAGETALFPRPLTHGFIVAMLQELGARLLSVRLTAVVEGVCIAEAILSHAGRRSAIDCSLSDGIAIALRCGAPILASSVVASHARDISEVLALLPEHIRTMTAAKLAALRVDAPQNPTALAAATGRDARRELLGMARSMLGEGWAKEKKDIAAGLDHFLAMLEKSAPRGTGSEAPMPGPPLPGTDCADAPSGDEARREHLKATQIRVSLVRHTSDGKSRIVNEFTVPEKALHIPSAVLAGLGLSPREAEAVNDTSDGDRWATLLRLLAPETKVPM